MIGIPLLENKKIGSIYEIFVSWFLIDMNLTSKLLEILLWQNECLLVPRLRLFMISRIQLPKKIKILKFQGFKFSKLQKIKKY